MINPNDTVKVDGKEAKVEATWASGRHRVYKLSDGREVLDLDSSSLVRKETAQPVTEIPVVDIPKRTSWSMPKRSD